MSLVQESCDICPPDGDGWVCEAHPDRPWEGSGAATACDCGGAGTPCANGCPFFSDDPLMGISVEEDLRVNGLLADGPA